MSGQVLESLHDVVSAEHPTYIGGGTDIMPLLKNEVRDDKDFVFLKKIPELHVLEEKDGELIIGAAMTLTELAESELLNSRYAAIAQAASLTASPQIRNIATVGGNIMQDRRCIYFNQPHLWRSGLAYCFKTGGSICHQIPNSPVCRAIYYSDVATALIAYEAEVEYIEDGETTIIGDNVKLYQGATLGALSPAGMATNPNVRRHPKVGNNVVIYANSTLLGGATEIGDNVVVGGNAFLTSSVAPNTVVSVKNPEMTFRGKHHRG